VVDSQHPATCCNNTLQKCTVTKFPEPVCSSFAHLGVYVAVNEDGGGEGRGGGGNRLTC